MLELVDPMPETVILELIAAIPRLEAAERYSYKDFDT